MTTLAARYKELEFSREPFLQRARKCAALTIPTLLTEVGFNSTSDVITPYSAFGARAVNNLSSKLLLTLLPPTGSFFKLSVDDYTASELGATDKGQKSLAEIENSFSTMERAVMAHIESSAIRINTFEAIKSLIVTGTVLCKVLDKGMRVFHLDQHVICRDAEGNVTEFITKECVSKNTLDSEILEQIEESVSEEKKNEDEVEIYTVVCLEEANRWTTWQEISDIEITGTRGTYTDDTLPYLPLRMNAIANESYGRGMVEEYLGDFISLESLTQAIVEASAAMSRILFLVNPNSGLTNKADIADAPNGAVRDGVASDVTVLQVNKFNDLQISEGLRAKLTEDLSKAFMLGSTIQRQGDRVTATEIRYMIQDLETSLGGTYSVLAEEFQKRLVHIVIGKLEKAKLIPLVPKSAKLSIITGLEGLGRGAELQKLQEFVGGLLQVFGPQITAQIIDTQEYAKRTAAALAINAKDLIKAPETVSQEDNTNMMRGLAGKLGPSVVQALSKLSPEQASAALGQIGQYMNQNGVQSGLQGETNG